MFRPHTADNGLRVLRIPFVNIDANHRNGLLSCLADTILDLSVVVRPKAFPVETWQDMDSEDEQDMAAEALLEAEPRWAPSMQAQDVCV